jgi:hypothetical protein
MNEYKPDYWKVLKITSTDGTVLYKVFASWVGGYEYGDSWKMNSGITEVKSEGDYLLFKGYSGSVYNVVNKDQSYRTTMYTQSVLSSMSKRAVLVGAKIEELPFETKWEELIV